MTHHEKISQRPVARGLLPGEKPVQRIGQRFERIVRHIQAHRAEEHRKRAVRAAERRIDRQPRGKSRSQRLIFRTLALDFAEAACVLVDHLRRGAGIFLALGAEKRRAGNALPACGTSLFSPAQSGRR